MKMWDFLWHMRGSAHLRGEQSNQEVLDGIEALLKRQRKPLSKRSSNEVIFNSPLWQSYLGPNWLAMVVYDHGRIGIDQHTNDRVLRYDLRSLHGFVFCLLGAVMFFAFGVAVGGLIKGISYAAFAFGWLYGMNMVLAWARIPRMIRNAVENR